jgi:hypothetical protein
MRTILSRSLVPYYFQLVWHSLNQSTSLPKLIKFFKTNYES